MSGALRAMANLAKFCIDNKGSGGADRIREILLSLYNGRLCDLSAIHYLDSDLRHDLSVVIGNMGVTIFDHQIRLAFSAISKQATGWFLEPLGVDAESLNAHYSIDLESISREN